jgi:hypothetical protein
VDRCELVPYSHYPYAEDVIDYADRQGIVLIDENGCGGSQYGPRGQHLRWSGLRSRFLPETVNDATREVHAQAIPGTDHSRQEPPERGDLEHRQRTRIRHPKAPRTTSARSSTSRATPTPPDRSGS